MASRKNSRHYINNKEFEATIKNYLEDPKTYEELLIKQLDLLISSILMSFKFKVEYDDAKQDCFVLALKVLKNFTPDKGSAFNYFTTVIVNNLKLIYTKNKKYQEKLQEYRNKKIKTFLDDELWKSRKPWGILYPLVPSYL